MDYIIIGEDLCKSVDGTIKGMVELPGRWEYIDNFWVADEPGTLYYDEFVITIDEPSFIFRACDCAKGANPLVVVPCSDALNQLKQLKADAIKQIKESKPYDCNDYLKTEEQVTI